MTDPSEVRASLLRGDSRDGCARRLAVLTDAPDRCEAFGGIRTTPAGDFAEGMKAAEADDAAQRDAALENMVRESLRDRLANVERLMGEFLDLYYAHHPTLPPLAATRFREALAEVRSLLGGQ